MKKFLLIPLLALFTCVNMWAGTTTPIAVVGVDTFFVETERTSNEHPYYKSDGEALKAAIKAVGAENNVVTVLNNVSTSAGKAVFSNSSTTWIPAAVNDVTIQGDENKSNLTININFDVYGGKTLKLQNISIEPTATTPQAVQLYPSSKLSLDSNAHVIGKKGKNAIKTYAAEGLATIEVTGKSNSIASTPGNASSHTFAGGYCSLEITGNGYLTAENILGSETTSGFLFSGESNKLSTFVLNAPHATYTYSAGHNVTTNMAHSVEVTYSDGTYTPEIATAVANGYEVYNYTQFIDALNKIEDNQDKVIKLKNNIWIAKQVVIDKSLTIDFGGYKVSTNRGNMLQVGANSESTNTVTFMNSSQNANLVCVTTSSAAEGGGAVSVCSNAVFNGGKYESTGAAKYGCRALNIQSGANVIINGGTFTSKAYAIFTELNDTPKPIKLTINDGTFTSTTGNANTAVVDMGGNVLSSDADRVAYPDTITINGGTFSGAYTGVKVLGKGAVLNVAGGSISGLAYGIAGNGTDACSGTKINISAGTIASSAEGGAAIYHPQNGTLKIKGNPVITGHTAIQMCAGTGMTASITGGRFEATGADQSAGKSGDGAIGDGAALSLVARDGYAGAPNFTVSGGTFLSKQSTAIKAYMWANNTMSTWADRKNYLSITEGLFSHDPSEYVADGKKEGSETPMYKVEVITSPYADYDNLYQVSFNVEEEEMADNFTEAEAEYVRIGTSTTETEDTSLDPGTNTVTLEDNQNAKYIKVEENYNLVIDENVTLNIGTGGLLLEDNATLTIKPNAVVTVGTNGIINSNAEENLVLESNAEEQAVLLIDPDVVQNTKPQATVVLHTKARQKSANPGNYIWEYFASPVEVITSENKPSNNFNKAIHGLYEGETSFITGVYTWGGNDWAPVTSWTHLVPFKGYQLTNNSANGGVDYTFKGKLMGNNDGTYAFTAKGYGYFGNSYSAPIVISNFLSALDNTVYERTVWLYDAGADTYVSVNPLAARIGSVKYKGSTEPIREIRSLQAFILNKKSKGAGSAVVNYRDAIWNNPRINSLVATANPAPARHEADEMLWTNIYVSANGNKEMVTLIEDAEFTSAFDNGADAGKYINANSMNLYAATNDGEQAIVATDNLENTLISFQAGNATEYTLSFENGNEDYMLRDNVTGMTVAMEEGAEYTFTQAANTTVPARFEVIAAPKATTAIENVEEAAKATGIYTITGQYMGRDFTNLPAGVYVVNGVKIVK